VEKSIIQAKTITGEKFPHSVSFTETKIVTKKSYIFSSFVHVSHLYSYQMKLRRKCVYKYDVSDVQPNIIEIWYLYLHEVFS
jgi:hypothetical protein